MANSHILVLAFFIALSFSGIDVALGARRLLQGTSPEFPNLPPFRGFQFPPYNGPYPEYRLPAIPGNVPPGFPSFPFFSPPPALPNNTP
ncbi:hypothetical protein QQP08_008430 [Theobroma cacao]|uniref:Uncharacterized protein n=1 Tax=Theobroma cacao TaxID=3641 RepID=A0A061E192_THECC|nr:Uncharacterized protein TCM_007397 [Theobroma cacao]WRX15943.1 hypothetical protein QQP08_008430 [Theobroma cacao]